MGAVSLSEARLIDPCVNREAPSRIDRELGRGTDRARVSFCGQSGLVQDGFRDFVNRPVAVIVYPVVRDLQGAWVDAGVLVVAVNVACEAIAILVDDFVDRPVAVVVYTVVRDFRGIGVDAGVLVVAVDVAREAIAILVVKCFLNVLSVMPFIPCSFLNLLICD